MYYCTMYSVISMLSINYQKALTTNKHILYTVNKCIHDVHQDEKEQCSQLILVTIQYMYSETMKKMFKPSTVLQAC